LRFARAINNSMPHYTVESLQDALNEIEKPFKNTHIGLLGVSYKANVGDLRESPALKIIELLEERGVKLHIFDPYVPEKSNVANLEELLEKSQAVVVAADHDEFRKISAETLKEQGIRVIIDGKNCLDKEKILELGIIYKGIGR